MKPLLLGLTPLAILAGCGYSQESYEADRVEALCRYEVQCFATWEDLESCEEARAEEIGGECPEYDEDAAKECVRGIEDLLCPADDTFQPMPEACDRACGGAEDTDTDTDTDLDTGTDSRR